MMYFLCTFIINQNNGGFPSKKKIQLNLFQLAIKLFNSNCKVFVS